MLDRRSLSLQCHRDMHFLSHVGSEQSAGSY